VSCIVCARPGCTDAAADALEAEVKQQAASVTKKGAKGKKGKPAAAAKTKAKVRQAGHMGIELMVLQM